MELSWKDAIIRVLRDSAEAMHYTEIVDAIADREYRSEWGATPGATVNSIISLSLKNEGTKSPFLRIDRGRYWLREKFSASESIAHTAPR